ncbi:MAG TPA: TlpA disulfide reductase family protein [Bryobacteraceae bacterium]|nr:TlpA disulfide reductase family protein [Bryobacteraceae bacterium]
MRSWAAVFFITGPGFLAAQAPPALPGCEPAPEVRQVLEDKLAPKTLQDMRFADRIAYRRNVLEDLIAKYPREVEPYRRLLEATFQDDTEHMPELVDRYRKQAERNPEDPLALYRAGAALVNRDTTMAVKYLEQARTLAPGFAWPALELAGIYSPGRKRADKPKAEAEITAFFAACPASTEFWAQTRLGRIGSPELQARVAAALRARLANETAPERLKDYAVLWSIEFRVRPPREHDALRRQVAADLRRLETLNPKPDAAWLVFLKDGYKQSGAAPETVLAMEDRLIREFPRSEEAWRVVEARWQKAHPEPDDQSDRAAWAKYHAAYRAALKDWIPRFTESRELQHEAWFYEIREDPDVSPEVGLSILDDYLANAAPYQPPAIGAENAAEFLVDHKWQPARVFDLLRDADRLRDQWHVRMLGDNLSAESEDLWSANEVIMRQSVAGNILVAARLAERPEAAERVVPYVERELPANTWEIVETRYWQNRGRLAALEGRKADALAYYQKALAARKKPVQPFEGRVRDDLTDEARALWNQLGGTESAWNLWIKPPARIQQTQETGWKAPAKTMPAFELTDLSGRVWRLKELAGRAVLINVWATWCGPCKAELPHLQQLYDQVKSRNDLQILTLSIDEDPGAVAPFMKEHAYTFPVLPAQSFVTGLLDAVYIPQNWILDTKGAWKWTGAPSVPDAQWKEAVLKQLESAR